MDEFVKWFQGKVDIIFAEGRGYTQWLIIAIVIIALSKLLRINVKVGS